MALGACTVVGRPAERGKRTVNLGGQHELKYFWILITTLELDFTTEALFYSYVNNIHQVVWPCFRQLSQYRI